MAYDVDSSQLIFQEWLQDLKAFLADEQTLMIMAGNAVLGK